METTNYYIIMSNLNNGGWEVYPSEKLPVTVKADSWQDAITNWIDKYKGDDVQYQVISEVDSGGGSGIMDIAAEWIADDEGTIPYKVKAVFLVASNQILWDMTNDD